MIKMVVLGGMAVLLVAAVVAGIAFRERLAFAANYYQAYHAGKRFYAQYPYQSRDLAFHPEMAPRLDVYWPEPGTPGRGENGYPVLIFVHGGAWTSYRKELFAPVASKMLPEGMVVVIPDYTLFPDAEYDQMAEEMAAAIRWTLDSIQTYGGDPQRVVVAGHSAGAHLLSLAAMAPRFRDAYDLGGQLCGLVGMSGVYDVQAEYDFWRDKRGNPRLIERVMGGQQNFRAASPIAYVRDGLPPFLLIHGDQDKSVPVAIAYSFYEALQEAGAPARLRILPATAHSDYVFAALSGDRAALVAELAAFVRDCRP